MEKRSGFTTLSRSQLLLRILAAIFFASLITAIKAQENELPPSQLCDEGEVAIILEEKKGFLERVCDDNQITFTELEREESAYIEMLTGLLKRSKEEGRIEADRFENTVRSVTEAIILLHKAMEAF